jgi:hypothetical protein
VSEVSGLAIAANGELAIEGWEDPDAIDVNSPSGDVVFGLAADNSELWRVTLPESMESGLGRTISATPDGHVVSATWQDIYPYTVGSLQVSSYDLAGSGATASVGSRSSPVRSSYGWVGASTATKTGAIVVDGSLFGTIDFGFGPIGRVDMTPNDYGDNSGMFIVVIDPL